MAKTAKTTVTERSQKHLAPSADPALAPINDPPIADLPEPFPFEPPWDRNLVAAFLGLTASGLDKLILAGRAPPHFRAGRRLRWRPSVVEAWAENGGSEPHS